MDREDGVHTYNGMDREDGVHTYNGMDREDGVHTYNGMLLSHKENKIMPFATTWMNLETIILSEVSRTEKGK